MVDVQARQRLLNKQSEQVINKKIDDLAHRIPTNIEPKIIIPTSPETKALTAKIGQLTETIAQQQVNQPKVVTPTEGLTNELRSLQRVIGNGNLIDSLAELSKGLNSFELNTDAVTTL